MEVVELLAHDGQTVLIGHVLAVEGVAAGHIAGGLVGAAAGAQHDRLRGEGDDRGALEVQAHRAADAPVVGGEQLGHHDVVGHGDRVGVEDLHPLVMALVLDVGLEVGLVVGVVGIAAGRRVQVATDDAEIDVLLVGGPGVLHVVGEVVDVGDVLAGLGHGLERALVLVPVGVVVGAACGEGSQARVAGQALVGEHHVGAGFLRGHGRVQAGPAAAHHEHVVLVGGRLGRRGVAGHVQLGHDGVGALVGQRRRRRRQGAQRGRASHGGGCFQEVPTVALHVSPFLSVSLESSPAMQTTNPTLGRKGPRRIPRSCPACSI